MSNVRLADFVFQSLKNWKSLQSRKKKLKPSGLGRELDWAGLEGGLGRTPLGKGWVGGAEGMSLALLGEGSVWNGFGGRNTMGWVMSITAK